MNATKNSRIFDVDLPVFFFLFFVGIFFLSQQILYRPFSLKYVQYFEFPLILNSRRYTTPKVVVIYDVRGYVHWLTLINIWQHNTTDPFSFQRETNIPMESLSTFD